MTKVAVGSFINISEKLMLLVFRQRAVPKPKHSLNIMPLEGGVCAYGAERNTSLEEGPAKITNPDAKNATLVLST